MQIKESDKNFLEISGTRLPVSSRLNLHNILKDVESNIYFLNIFKNYRLIDEIKYNNIYFIVYYAEEEDWWDNISYKFYRTEHLWYLICMMNDIVNPFEEIQEGQLIKVPVEDLLYDIFNGFMKLSRY